MSYTRRQFVVAAYEEMGLASYVYDLAPEQLEAAARRLDAMMAQWNTMGIRLGYPVPGSPEDTSLDAETGVPDAASEPIITNLAVRLAPGIGKAISADTKATARAGYNSLLMRASLPPEMQMPASMPAGAGNKPWSIDDPFLSDPVDPILAGQDGPLQFD